MIAALPMYLRPSNRAAHRAFWALVRDGLRARGVTAPDALDETLSPEAGWGHSELVLGQICNLPLRTVFAGRVTVVATADYGLDGCQPGYYRSHYVTRPGVEGPLWGRRWAINSRLSQSGYGTPWAEARAAGADLNVVLETGAHAGSVEAVQDGRADVAAIDAQTWRHLEVEGLTDGLVISGHTMPTPAMTFITRAGQDPAPYRAAIAEAVAALPAEHRATLHLRGIVELPPAAYDLPVPPKARAAA